MGQSLEVTIDKAISLCLLLAGVDVDAITVNDADLVWLTLSGLRRVKVGLYGGRRKLGRIMWLITHKLQISLGMCKRAAGGTRRLIENFGAREHLYGLGET
jgi:hypothetical protein